MCIEASASDEFQGNTTTVGNINIVNMIIIKTNNMASQKYKLVLIIQIKHNQKLFKAIFIQ